MSRLAAAMDDCGRLCTGGKELEVRRYIRLSYGALAAVLSFVVVSS
jgi:hypothetical protein